MTLEVGSKGKVSFKAPYDIYNKDIEWTIISIQTIPHIKAFGINVLSLVYQNDELADNKLEEADYDEDIKQGVAIVAFSNDSQEILYIPADRLDLSNSEYSYKYLEKVLAIPLPALPVEFDLTGLKDDIKILIKEKISYDVNIEEVPISGITLVKESDNILFYQGLNNNVIDKRDYRTKFLEEVEKNTLINTSLTEIKALAIRLKKQLEALDEDNI